AGEIRLGERVKVLSFDNAQQWEDALLDSPARYVLLGLPEDIGVRANYGRGGAYSAWNPVVSTLLNVQSNRYFTGEQLLVLGHIDFSELMDKAAALNFQDPADVAVARELVAEVDELVKPIIEAIVKAGKEPIIIGGGHNNAYPNIKGAVSGLQSKLNKTFASIDCINCDAHSDLRPLEGRHSGNGFSYALASGDLRRYAMVGLHEIFNTDVVIEQIHSDDRLHASFFEDLFVKGDDGFEEAVMDAIRFAGTDFTGLELDLDTIQNIPSSAKTSSGISTIQARKFVHMVASKCNVVYFHIAEAAPVLSHIKTDLKTGKLIAYLITDYLKAREFWHAQYS
ncbi:MAG TPA: formimidoylglutamase, partial [Bacteroidia bacterium]|nr:formimidoylglutamase [Bacteroidia bacterium]